MPALPELRRRRPGLVGRGVVGRVVAGSSVAGPRADDAVRVAAELVAGGRRVAFEHLPGRLDDPVAGTTGLVARLAAAGLAAAAEIDLPVDRLDSAAHGLVALAADAGLAVCLHGPAAAVVGPASRHPAARIAVPAGDPHAEERCRRLAGRAVRLVEGRGGAADLAFVRCLNLLMTDAGHLSVATADPRLLAVTGERAAWYDRAHETWEHLMPYGRRTDEQQRLVAAGNSVRVRVPWGSGAAGAQVRRLVGVAAR